MTPAAVAEMPAACAEVEWSADELRAFIERDVIVAMAGGIAEQRSMKGSEAGFIRWRSQAELYAYHESGHIVVAAALGWCPWKASIVPDSSVKVGRGTRAGFAQYGVTDEPPMAPDSGIENETDRQSAAKSLLCLSLRGEEGPRGWRGAIRIANRLRSQAHSLIEGNWSVVNRLAIALVQYRELNRDQIGRLLRLDKM